MGLKAGIIGLPNSGKTTLFNLLTRAHAAVAPYPFCTIEPNLGVVNVPDPRLEKLAEFLKPPRVVPATVEFVDVAGLVEGASKGEGLGNQFLSAVRGVDAVVEVIRFFLDSNVPHFMGELNPQRDREVVDLELMLSDLEIVERRLQKVQELFKKTSSKELQKEKDLLLCLRDALSRGIPLRKLTFSKEEMVILKPFQLITLKPVIYLANLDESEQALALYREMEKLCEEDNAPLLPLMVKLEQELQEIEDPEERKVLMEEFGLSESGLAAFIRKTYATLGLITFYTFGDKELRAWELRRGSTAREAAGKVHTDMQKGFIKAEVINAEELIQIGSLEQARALGRIRLEGKEYQVQDGDLLYFHFSV
ncbi:MAG: redox-regulated ATPase YchF [Candidatus Atribacteria bacterium]|nr:redox-regulated ATPase YchF [Candidatus Atribacteria bacterium]MCD6349416.1 redox-regulated ATPase YchF [Candidatus Atribacteria bacterium]